MGCGKNFRLRIWVLNYRKVNLSDRNLTSLSRQKLFFHVKLLWYHQFHLGRRICDIHSISPSHLCSTFWWYYKNSDYIHKSKILGCGKNFNQDLSLNDPGFKGLETKSIFQSIKIYLYMGLPSWEIKAWNFQGFGLTSLKGQGGDMGRRSLPYSTLWLEYTIKVCRETTLQPGNFTLACSLPWNTAFYPDF